MITKNSSVASTQDFKIANFSYNPKVEFNFSLCLKIFHRKELFIQFKVCHAKRNYANKQLDYFLQRFTPRLDRDRVNGT